MKFEDSIILVIEDDINVSKTLKFMIEEMNVKEVITFTDSLDASKYLESNINKIDLILCDWNMPLKTGLTLLKDVRKINPVIPFVMVTARADRDSVLQAKADGVTNYIIKPITHETLKRKIVEVLKIEE